MSEMNCPHCGLPFEIKDEEPTAEDWLECIPLPYEIAALPAGYIAPAISTTVDGWIYIDGNGDKMSRERYIQKWGVDPYINLKIRGRIK